MVVDTQKVVSWVMDIFIPTLLVAVAGGALLFGYKFYSVTNSYYHASVELQYHQALALEAFEAELGGRKPTTAKNGEDTSTQ